MSAATRRELLAGVALLGLGAGADHLLQQSSPGHTRRDGESDVVDFYGEHQAGVATPAQDHMHFAAFDLATDEIDRLRALLEQWTTAADSLTNGRPSRAGLSDREGSPLDTGEAGGLAPAHLTLTFGFGPTLFDGAVHDSFGLLRRRPRELQTLPPFQGDALDTSISGGDLCVQACADDPQVAFHAVHVLSRLAEGVATVRWTQQGFGRTSSTSRKQETARNLMGFKDGTDNIRGEDRGAMSRYVWVQPEDGPDWMVGGSYLIARRIRILFDVWDAAPLQEQQRVIGRDKASGAPLGASREYDPVDLNATDAGGEPAIAADAHIRLASPTYNDQRILRRGYSYSEAVEPGSGQINAGLFFIAFQRSPTRQFIPIQRRLAASDALNRHTVHTSSAIFACPPGIKPGEFVGQALLE
jgi:deferrochelatase/peroxidase EfeB